MTPKYRTYKINKGDTLTSVARSLGISPQEARSFHNIFSSEDDLISVDLPAHLETLYVYPHIYEKVKDTSAFVKLDPGYTLRFKPEDRTLHYGVMYTILSGTEEVNTIKYEVSTAFKGYNENGLYLFEIDRLSNTYINDEEASAIADELAEKVSSVIYPLGVVVNHEGNWTDIYNFEEVQRRWKYVKKRIFKEYEGEWVEKYIALSEESLEDKDRLKTSLSGDWFLNSYFGGIYTSYTPKFTFRNTVSFPIIPHIKPVEYEVEQEVKMLLDEYNLAQISQKGHLSDKRTKADLENRLNFPHETLINPGAKKAEGEFRTKYFLNSTNNLIESLFLECYIRLSAPKKVEVVVSLLEDKNTEDHE